MSEVDERGAVPATSVSCQFLDLPWRWQLSAGTLKLVADTPDGGNLLLLRAPADGALLTRSDGGYRRLEPTDDLAKAIAAAPAVRRHALALLNSIDRGEESDPSFRVLVAQLRKALKIPPN